MPIRACSEGRVGLIKPGFDRLLLGCRVCKHYFFMLRRDFNPQVPLVCPSCGVSDEAPYDPDPELLTIMAFNTAASIPRWREGYLAQESKFPSSSFNTANVNIPAWFFDMLMPRLTRFETLTCFVLRRFADGDGWTRMSQRTLAFRLAQVKEPTGLNMPPAAAQDPGKPLHVPARQNVSKAISGLRSISLAIEVNGKEFNRDLVHLARSDGRSFRVKLDLTLPPGGKVNQVTRLL